MLAGYLQQSSKKVSGDNQTVISRNLAKNQNLDTIFNNENIKFDRPSG